MSTIYLHQTTTLTPEQYIAGLTDFGPGRSKLFGNSTDEYMKVHSLGRTQADVTEDSGGIWERLHYDWSDPNHVVLKTTDSNTWGGASGHTYNFTRRPDGKTDIDVIVVREGKNLKGWIVGLVVGTIGKSVLGKAFVNSVKAIEARNAGAKGMAAATSCRAQVLMVRLALVRNFHFFLVTRISRNNVASSTTSVPVMTSPDTVKSQRFFLGISAVHSSFLFFSSYLHCSGPMNCFSAATTL
jgi:hypothetical protein